MCARICFLLAVLRLFGCEVFGSEVVQDEESARVSLVALLANPELYSGRRVQVTGYYVGGFEESALYLSREKAKLCDISSGVWIGLADAKVPGLPKLRRGFVTVTGVFQGGSSGAFGHLGGWNCSIRDVTRFELVRSRIDLPSITDMIFLVVSALFFIYACFAKSWYRALAVSLFVSVLWVLARIPALWIDQHQVSLADPTLWGRPLLWVLWSGVARGTKLVVFRIPFLARIERAVKGPAVSSTKEKVVRP